MATPITTVAGKGAPLNTQEFDTNLTNLRDAADNAQADVDVLTDLYLFDTVKSQAGPGSAFDADMVDGKHSSDFLTTELVNESRQVTDANDSACTAKGLTVFWLASPYTNGPETSGVLVTLTYSVNYAYQTFYGTNNGQVYYRERLAGAWGSWSKVWTAGTDGSGSGLDADKVDGYEAKFLGPTLADRTSEKTPNDMFAAMGNTAYVLYQQTVGGVSGYPDSAYGTILGVTWDNSSGFGYEIYRPYNADRFWFRTPASGTTWTAWSLISGGATDWIDVAYSAGNWTASAGAWNVDSGDIEAYRYKMLSPDTMLLQMCVYNTSVTANPNYLIFAIPNGKSLVGFHAVACSGIDNGTEVIAIADGGNTATTIGIHKVPVAGFGVSTNNTTMRVQMILKVA